MLRLFTQRITVSDSRLVCVASVCVQYELQVGGVYSTTGGALYTRTAVPYTSVIRRRIIRKIFANLGTDTTRQTRVSYGAARPQTLASFYVSLQVYKHL